MYYLPYKLMKIVVVLLALSCVAGSDTEGSGTCDLEGSVCTGKCCSQTICDQTIKKADPPIRCCDENERTQPVRPGDCSQCPKCESNVVTTNSAISKSTQTNVAGNRTTTNVATTNSAITKSTRTNVATTNSAISESKIANVARNIRMGYGATIVAYICVISIQQLWWIKLVH